MAVSQREPLQWSESFVVGHEAIDKEHRTLIQIINDVDEAARTNPRRVPFLLKMLRLATEDHFRTENSILWKLRTGTYEGASGSAAAPRVLAGTAPTFFDDHIADHASLVVRFEEFERASTASVGDELKSWFVDHVFRMDAHLKTIFQAMQ